MIGGSKLRVQLPFTMEVNLERFKVLLDHSSEIILLSDPFDFGRIIDFNQCAIRALGYSRDELLKMKVSDIEVACPIASEEEWRELVTELRARGSSMLLKGRQKRKDGTTFPVEISASLVEFEGREFTLGVGSDISKREKAERELKESERYFRKLIELSSSAILHLDKHGKFLYQSSMAADFAGYELDKGECKDVFYYVHTEDLSSFRSEYLLLSKHPGMTRTGEYRFLQREGYYVWMEVTLTNMFEDESFRSIVGTYRGIDKRKRVERALRESERRFSQVTGSISDVFFLYNTLTEQIEFISQNSKEVLGVDIDFFQRGGRYITQYIYALDRKIVKVGWDRVKEGIPGEFEFRVVVEGEYRWIKAKAFPVKDENGRVEKISGTSSDITLTKYREQQLIRAKELADTASRSKSIFVASISHEIRTPMNAILGFSEILSKRLQDSKARSFAEQIREAGKNLMVLIDDVLDLSNIEAGKMKILPVTLKVREFVDEIRSTFIHFEKENVHFEVSISDDVPETLYIDAVRLRQVLFNLLGNAFKFTDRGTVSLAVSHVSGQIDTIVFIVTDTGIGIPSGEQTAIFDAFSQPNKPRSGKYGGAGLGLAITRLLVDLMEGSIELTSKPGTGSTFSVRFPSSRQSNPHEFTCM
jgi:PAS domain S-box-containing protein